MTTFRLENGAEAFRFFDDETEENSMKKMRVLMLATLMGAAVSGQAFADDTPAQSGTMKFNATLQEGTCQISGQNISHNFGSIGRNSPLLNDTPAYRALRIFNDDISIDNCPSSVSKVVVTPAFTLAGTSPYGVKNTYTPAANAAKITMVIYATHQLPSDFSEAFNNGESKSFDLVDGKVDIPIQSQVTTPGGATPTSGAASLNAQFAFTYQ